MDRLKNKVNEQETTIESSVSKIQFFTTRNNLKEELTAERRKHEIVKNKNAELVEDNLKMKHQLNQGYGKPEPPAGEANDLADVDTAAPSLNGGDFPNQNNTHNLALCKYQKQIN